MDNQLKDFFFDEQDRGRLVFENSPEYNELMEQCLSLFPGGDLPRPVFKLIETANLISFAHGLRLGLRLNRWTGDQSQIAVAK